MLVWKVTPLCHLEVRSRHTVVYNIGWDASAPCWLAGGFDEDVGAVQKLLIGLQELLGLVADVELSIVVEGEMDPPSKRFLVIRGIVWATRAVRCSGGMTPPPCMHL